MLSFTHTTRITVVDERRLKDRLDDVADCVMNDSPPVSGYNWVIGEICHGFF